MLLYRGSGAVEEGLAVVDQRAQGALVAATRRVGVVLEWRRCIGVVCGRGPGSQRGRWRPDDAVGNFDVFEAISRIGRRVALVRILV